ncbi:MAG: ice-binding family protein [Candidatus Falkowbacteria bacterium]|nr:ice-binding family protein [Candidatus Falkowbacteria bacterium]
MKKLKKIAIAVLVVAFIIGLSGPVTVQAVTTAPALGAAVGYSVYSDAGITNTGAGTHVWGNVGDNNVGRGGPNALIAGQVTGVIDDGTGIATDAFTTAYNFLDLGSQTPITPLNLNGDNTVTPGVYTVGATALTGTLTLNGAGVYIFRSDSSISVSGAGTMSLIGGATACNVFWQILTSMTISNAAHIEGTIIAKTGNITFVSGASLKGRALAHTEITMDNNQITEPTCAVIPPAESRTPRTGTINVVKTVINDNGGTKTVADFPLFVSGTLVVSGITNTFRAPAGMYTVTETTNSNYTRTFSGDCDANGDLNLVPGDNKFCIITNNDIGAPVITPPVPPLIDVVKVPNPLALPDGPGSVEYTYTLRNIGTVPVTNVTMVGDTCRPIVLASGDTNADAKLDVTETGLSATDIASAHVVVGLPIVPPLIHVTKIPSPLTLLAGGGTVTYTEKITNPGTVALSNVRLSDDKCSPMKYISGDIDSDSKLDVTETWTYTCKTKLTTTTTNTAVATGEANGLTARDFAIATVVVAAVVPTLPNTGLGAGTTLGSIIMLAGVLALISASLVIALKKSKV